MKDFFDKGTSKQAEILTRLGMPADPYRGIEPFRLIDRPIFQAREDAVRNLFRSTMIYRAVILSGTSGVGKSSLLNAGLIPRFIEEGGWIERVRVQPLPECEFVIDRLSIDEHELGSLLPSIFAPEEKKEPRVVLSANDILEAIREKTGGFESTRPLILLCDQFEESVTLFEEAPDSRERYESARKSQNRVFEVLNALICDEDLPVKLLFAMREDYLSKVLRHFDSFYSQIRNQEIRLDQLAVDDLPAIISGPYKACNAKGEPLFERMLEEESTKALEAGLRSESESGAISLTETQIACRTLWDYPKEEQRFVEISRSKGEEKAVQYLYGRHMDIAMESLPSHLQRPAKIALSKLVTSRQTRNIVSSENLEAGLVSEGISEDMAKESISLLCEKTRLVYRQSRGETPFYEIVSESLVPWILKEKAVIEEEQERSRRLEELTEETKRQEELRAVREEAAAVAETKLEGTQSRLEEAETMLEKARKARWIALSIGAFGILIAGIFSSTSAKSRIRAAQAQIADIQLEHEEALGSVLAELEKKKAEVKDAGTQLREKVAEVDKIHASNRELNDRLQATEETLQSMVNENNALITQIREFQESVSQVSITQAESDKLNQIANSLIEKTQTSSGAINRTRADLGAVANAIDALGWRRGRISTFGGPDDMGLSTNEGLALVSNWEEADLTGVFSPDADRTLLPPRGSQLNPDSLYIATRWNYEETSREWLLKNKVRVRNPLTGREVEAQPVDWGPAVQTGRLFEVSPGVAQALDLHKDDEAEYLVESPEQVLIARLTGHEGPIHEAVFSSSPGNYVATASADKYVKVWTPEGVNLQTIQGSSSRGGVRTVAFVPGSDYLLSGSSGQSVRLLKWRGEKTGEVAQSPASGDTVTRIVYNPENPEMVAVARVGSCMLLNLPSNPGIARYLTSGGALLEQWRHTNGKAVTWADFNLDGSAVVTSSDDYKVRVFSTYPPYDLLPDEYVGNPVDCRAPVRRSVFAPIVEERIIAGGAGTKVLLWKVGSNRKLRLLDQATGGLGHEGGVMQVAFSSDGLHLASVATDGRCILWDVREEKAIRELDSLLKGRLMGCAWRGDLLALVAEDGNLELWNMEDTGEPILEFAERAHEGVAAGVNFSEDGKLLLTWSGIPILENIPSAKGKAASWSSEETLKRSDNSAALWRVETEKQGASGGVEQK